MFVNGQKVDLDHVSLSILPREFAAIVGGSGAHKSPLLGYVPQNAILHMTLMVEKALDYAARLRLPINVTPAERKHLIAAVLDTVSMNTETIGNQKNRKDG